MSLLRLSALVLIAASLVVAGLALSAGHDPVRAVRAPELRAAPEPFAVTPEAGSADYEARSEIRIGSFERPESVPEYGILDEERDERAGARGTWLLVDTRARDQEDYVRITRDVKARYADLDAVSLEFVDLTRRLRYGGWAVIFNTAAGVDYIGYVYAPPNADGYLVRTADD